MKIWQWVLVAVVVLAVLAAGVAGWFFFKRPLAVFAWQTRIALGSLGLEKRHLDSSSGRLTVFVGGEGPPLVLLHGAGDQAGTWSTVAGRLKPGRTLIIPDLAGHGGSEPRTGTIKTAQVLAGVEAVVRELSGGRPATIVGNSLGGWMAMLVAHRHPEWVDRIVVVNGGAVKGSNENARILPRSRAEALEAVVQLRDPASPPVPAFLLDDIVRQAKDGPLARFAASAATMDEFTLDGRLGEITVPVALLWGESDRLMPLDYARRMFAELPRATLTTVPRCGHVPQVECPDRLLAVLLPLLEAQP